MLVMSNSPAPRASTCLAHLSASILSRTASAVGVDFPMRVLVQSQCRFTIDWRAIRDFAFYSLVVYGDDDTLAPEKVGSLLHEARIVDGRRIEGHLIGPGFEHLANVPDGAHPSTKPSEG